jgi:hypothetical protein
MEWLDAALYPFYHRQWKQLLLLPGFIIVNMLIMAFVIGGGFLWIVGFKAIAVSMACFPLILLGLSITCVALGYLWEVFAYLLDEQEDFPGLQNWSQLLLQGAQCLLFYSVLIGLSVAATVYLHPYGLVIPVFFLFFHPLLMAPMLFSSKRKSLMGLIEGCSDTVSLLGPDYFKLWMHSSCYLLIVGGMLYPILSYISALTIAGVLLLPGLYCCFMAGYVYLITNLAQDQFFSCKAVVAEPGTKNPFEHQLLVLKQKPVYRDLSYFEAYQEEYYYPPQNTSFRPPAQ